MELTATFLPEPEQLRRPVNLTNDEWLVVLQSMESFSDSYRAKHSQTIATYVTRGQINEAVSEAQRMEQLLQKLDRIQAQLVS